MRDEEKAKELANDYKNYTHTNAIHLHLEGKSKEEVVEQCVYAAVHEMAAWKEQQMIKWLEDNAILYAYDEFGNKAYYDTDEMIEDFKKAMEE